MSIAHQQNLLALYGSGGWPWNVIEDMPVYERRAAFEWLEMARKEEKRQLDEDRAKAGVK